MIFLNNMKKEAKLETSTKDQSESHDRQLIKTVAFCCATFAKSVKHPEMVDNVDAMTGELSDHLSEVVTMDGAQASLLMIHELINHALEIK